MEIFEYSYTPRVGGTTTTAITRTLDSTNLSQTEVLLRESVQNSYDAKLKNEKPLEMFFNCYRFSKQNISDIQKLIGRDGLNKYGQELVLKLFPSSYNLEISDRNSTGLTGKAGFQEAEKSKEEEKFHHFVYMTGNDDNKDEFSGGSFGFGKASLYKYSGLRTIAVYSKIKKDEIFETRFILCRIDERIKNNSSRCWWGTIGYYKDGTNYAAPLLNKDADYAAKCFNMKPFSVDETGTDVLLLDVSCQKELQDKIPDSTFEHTFKDLFPELILHWFWPKTNSIKPEKRINFHLIFEEKDFSYRLLNPINYYPYNYFLKSLNTFYETKEIDESKGIFHVEKKRPNQSIGKVVLTKSNVKEYKLKYLESNFSNPTIAWMRDVEFIVKYFPSYQNLKEGKTTFGIFHTNYELESYFRTFENQTHDEWNFKRQNEGCYNYDFINPIPLAIDQAVRKLYGINDNIEANSTVSAGIAEQLGSFLGFGFRGGASITPKVPSTSVGGKRNSKRASFKRTKNIPILDSEDNKKFIYIEYEALNINKKTNVMLIPYLKSNDNERTIEIAGDNELKIICATLNKQNINIKKSIDNKYYNLEINTNGKYLIKIEYGVQCSFDIKNEIVNNK